MTIRLILPRRRSVARALVARGSAIVLVTAAAAWSACATDTVVPPPVDCPAAEVSPSSRALFAGDTVRFVASFASCFGPGVTWYVSNPAVAYIVTADSNSVLVKAVSIGTASVVAQANADPDVRAAGLVTVLRSGTLPRNVSLRAGTRVVQVAGATPAQEVSVTLLNTTPASVHVAAGPQCPFVSIFADPTGEPMGSLTGAMTCPAEPSVDVAPGDSTVLTRVLPADTLATFPPGTYGVNVAVTTNLGLTGTWAGAVQLPLARVPQVPEIDRAEPPQTRAP